MKKYMPQIFPRFIRVKLISQNESYDKIYESEKLAKHAYLIAESESLHEFIQKLGEEDTNNKNIPLDLYNFYAAYNIKFPNITSTVMIMNKHRIVALHLNDFSELLETIIHLPIREQHAIFIKENDFTISELNILKRKILQQFMYLRIYFPIIISSDFKSAQKIFENLLRSYSYESKELKDIGIFGTKKAGKSSMIDALLENEYAPISSSLPTPNRVVYSPTKFYNKLSLKYEGRIKNFYRIEQLQNYLTEEFKRANENAAALDEMQIAIPKFPKSLSKFRLIDTPGPNFAGAKDHAKITMDTLDKVNGVIFVMNYSQHLTSDEICLFDDIYKTFNNDKVQKTILIAINRIDEMYASEDIKSYERIASYIHYRLMELGYENVLVLSVSAIQAVYTEKIRQLLTFECGTLIERLKKLKKKYRDTDSGTFISFVDKSITELEDFHGVEIDNVHELKKISRIDYLCHLIQWLFID